MNLKNWLFSKNKDSGIASAGINETVKNYYLNEIAEWRDIYCGGGEWRFTRKGGIHGGIRRMNASNAAKSLCAELSALCFAEQAEIKTGNENTENYLREVLDDNSFWTCFPLFLEKMFALGGGVIKTYHSGGKVKLDYIDAEHFLPVQYDEKRIYSGIIISETQKENASFILAEYHEKTADSYVITNRLYKSAQNSLRYNKAELSEIYPKLAPRTEIKGADNPMFSYFRPACANAHNNSPFGVSVFAGCTDTLKSLDVVFDSLEREFVLGKKRIIVPVSAIKGNYDENGKLQRYFDTNDEVFQALSADDSEELKITDNSAQLRVTEHREAIEQLLDLLCMQTGLSAGALSYRGEAAKTAAEIIARENKTHRTKTAHRQLIRESMIIMIKNILMLGASLGKISQSDYENSGAEVVFADGIASDNNSKIDNALKLFSAGIIDREQALSAIYNTD